MDPGRIVSLFVPPRCPLCRGTCGSEALICGECMRILNHAPVLRGEPPEGIDRIASCAEHEGVARELLVAFKFRHLTGLAKLVAGFMADAAGPVGEGCLLVPVPPARVRVWLRGFDPVALLAAELTGMVRVQTARRPVLNRRGSGRQRGRGRSGRLSNPPDIRPAEGSIHILSGREVLLVDDVMTTGATLTAAADALRGAGAATVSALTFTRRL